MRKSECWKFKKYIFTQTYFRGWEGNIQVGPIPQVGDDDDKYIGDDDETIMMMVIMMYSN
jgi:hypothetical protein